MNMLLQELMLLALCSEQQFYSEHESSLRRRNVISHLLDYNIVLQSRRLQYQITRIIVNFLHFWIN
jgi:hypothetical protein